MTFSNVLNTGLREDLPDYVNERIRATNLLGIIIGSLSIPFCIITFLLFPSLLWSIILFTGLSFSVVLINYLGLFEISRFVICAALISNYTIYHCYLLPDDGTTVASLWGLQMVFWMLPLLIFDVREKGKLLVYLLFNVTLSFGIPYLNRLFSLDIDITILQSGWISEAFILGSIGGFMACVYFIISNYLNFIERNETLISEMTDKNLKMSENEVKLNLYLKEVEKAHADEQKRKWMSEGQALMAEILRGNEDSITMYDKILSGLVKYLKINQGAIFLSEKKTGENVLELKAYYAYEKKRFLEKTIRPGEGLVGQCFMEQESIYLTRVPDGYVSITSGLGGATPGSLMITPLKVNERIVGVMEFASFRKFEMHEIEFLEKIAESIASVIISIGMNESTKYLLQQSEMQTEEMRAQEEEMRQNLEELMATQEEMQRKESEVISKSEMMSLIIDNIPFPVFIKDEKGFYILVNKAEADIFEVPVSEMIGFDDSKFVLDGAEVIRIRKSDKKIVEENVPVYFPEQTILLENGEVKVFKTSKIPFMNKQTGKINILGVSVDLSDRKRVENELKEEIEALHQKLHKISLG